MKFIKFMDMDRVKWWDGKDYDHHLDVGPLFNLFCVHFISPSAKMIWLNYLHRYIQLDLYDFLLIIYLKHFKELCKIARNPCRVIEQATKQWPEFLQCNDTSKFPPRSHNTGSTCKVCTSWPSYLEFHVNM